MSGGRILEYWHLHQIIRSNHFHLYFKAITPSVDAECSWSPYSWLDMAICLVYALYHAWQGLTKQAAHGCHGHGATVLYNPLELFTCKGHTKSAKSWPTIGPTVCLPNVFSTSGHFRYLQILSVWVSETMTVELKGAAREQLQLLLRQWAKLRSAKYAKFHLDTRYTSVHIGTLCTLTLKWTPEGISKAGHPFGPWQSLASAHILTYFDHMFWSTQFHIKTVLKYAKMRELEL